MFRGSIPALVTPFRDEAFDEASFRDLVEWQISEGSHGLVPCGTTGEAATLDDDEHLRVVQLAVEERPEGATIVAGVGSNDTRHAVHLTARACELGATRGCTSLGSLYLEGRGVEEDEPRAVRLFAESCAGGEAAACYNLGLLFEQGRGVEADAHRAGMLFEQACLDGMKQACNR